MRNLRLLVSVFLLLFFIKSNAQILDTTFNGSGIWTGCSSANWTNDHNAIDVSQDGKIIIGNTIKTSANNYVFSITRLQPDGSLDSAFGTTGNCSLSPLSSVYTYLTDIESFNNGTLIAGINYSGYIVCRILDNGNIDTTFGSNGWIYETGYSNENDGFEVRILVISDGSFYVVSHNMYGNLIIGKRRSNGAIDPNFGTNGHLVLNDVIYGEDFCAWHLQSSGKIIVAANYPVQDTIYDYMLLRVNMNGTIDSAFGQNGRVNVKCPAVVGYMKSIDIQNDDKILLLGRMDGIACTFLTRYNPDGSVDLTFHGNGTSILGTAYEGFDVSFLYDKRILVTENSWLGTTYYYTYTMLNSFGYPDTSFNGNGIFQVLPGSILDEPQETIVVDSCRVITCGFTAPLQTTKVIRLNWCPPGVITSVREDSENIIKTIMPNPTSGIILLKQAVQKIWVYNIFGKLIMQEKNTGRIDLGQNPDGTYILKFLQDGMVSSHKVIKISH